MRDNKTNQQDLKCLVEEKDYLPNLSVDCTIFGFHDGSLKVLLLKYHNLDLWVVPGGFIHSDEDVTDAARRILYERTNLKDIFLHQFHTFGKKNRTENNVHKILMENKGIEVPDNHWMLQRYVTVAYCSIIDFTLVNTFTGLLNESCNWVDINNLPPMAMDHKEIVLKGLEQIKKNLDTNIVASNLLPEKFTMNDLQIIYETILNQKFRRNNFQRKILELNVLERLEKYYDGSANKAPYLYRFKDKGIEK